MHILEGHYSTHNRVRGAIKQVVWSQHSVGALDVFFDRCEITLEGSRLTTPETHPSASHKALSGCLLFF